MEMIFQCPHCNAEYQLPSTMADSEAECPDCGEIITIPPLRLGPGVIIGGFRMEKHLGHGSMGDVFLATQLSMGRKVAVKLLPQAMTVVEESVNRFLHEVQTSAKMEHPNIVTAFDAGQDNGTYYLAMSYVEGDNYDDMVRDGGAISESQALDVCVSAAKGLKYAWDEHQLLHRDIKPGNIMVDRHGTIKLMDLGISKSIHEDASLTVPGLVVGTPHYMSPEQAWSEDALDFRSDLYAVGATVYMLVTGRPPYVGSSQSVFTMLIRPEPFPHPQTLNANISDAMSALILTMMASKPEDRYQTWDELISECERVRSGQMPLRPQPARAGEPEMVPPPATVGDGGSSGVNNPGTKGTVSLTLKKAGPGTKTALAAEAAAAVEEPSGEMKLSAMGSAARIEPKTSGSSGLSLRKGPAPEHEVPVGENSQVIDKSKTTLGAGSDSTVIAPPDAGKSSGLRLKKPGQTNMPKPPEGIEESKLPPIIADQGKKKKKSGGKKTAAIVGPIVIVALLAGLGVAYMVTRPDEPEPMKHAGGPVVPPKVAPPTVVNVPTGPIKPKDPDGTTNPVDATDPTTPVEPEGPKLMTPEEIEAERAAIKARVEAEYLAAEEGVRIDEQALAEGLGIEIWPIEAPEKTIEEIDAEIRQKAEEEAVRRFPERNVETEADNRFGYVKKGQYVKVIVEEDGRKVAVDGLLKQVTSTRVRIGDKIVSLEDMDPDVAARFDPQTAAETVKKFIAEEKQQTADNRAAYVEQAIQNRTEEAYKNGGYVKQDGKWVAAIDIYEPAAEKELERQKRRLKEGMLKNAYREAGYRAENGQWVKQQ